MSDVEYCVFDTAIGPCGIAWEESVVVFFQLPDTSRSATEARIARVTKGMPSTLPPRKIANVIESVGKHLDGEIQDFRKVSVDLRYATPFARRVYEAARDIPSGRTLTYGELAAAIGSPLASRAVGQALGKNPLALIVPCHRVLAAGGNAGGFSAPGGTQSKFKLLSIEGVTL